MPLSERELHTLDDLLLNRPGLGDELRDVDEGILGVSELDGFLTAIVSGPEMIPPSQWMPLLWGDVEPTWESRADAERILGLIMRHMNGIAGELMECPDRFEPIFLERDDDGRTSTIVDDWCSGYMRGMWIDRDAWKDACSECLDLLRPIFVFGSDRGTEVLEGLDDATREEYRAGVTPASRAIHAFWLNRRSVPVVPRKAVKVGRNDPCPCGSGGKYKHCCA